MHSFEQLYKNRADYIYFLSQRLEYDDERIEHLFVETWRRIRRDLLQLSGVSEEKWLCQKLVESHRQFNRKSPHVDREPDRSVEGLIASLKTLGLEYRWPLILKECVGFGYGELGEVLGIPEATVRTRVARARTMLRRHQDGASAGDVDDELLSAFLDDELGRQERSVVSELVQVDPNWKGHLDGFEQDSAALKKMPAQELSERMRSRAYELACRNLEAGVDRRRVPRYRRRWMLVAAVILPTLFTLLFFQNPEATSRLYLKSEGLDVRAGRSVPEAEFEGRRHWSSPPLRGAYDPNGRSELRLEIDSESPEKQAIKVILEYDFDGNGHVDRTEMYSTCELNLGRSWQTFHPTIEKEEGEFRDFTGGKVHLILRGQTEGVFRLSGTPAELVLPYIDLRVE